MDTCHGYVLPASKEVLLGIHWFLLGVHVAFFLAAAASYFDSSLLISHESNQSQRYGAHFLFRVIVSFVPHITAILVGLETSTLFTNHDDIFR